MLTSVTALAAETQPACSPRPLASGSYEFSGRENPHVEAKGQPIGTIHYTRLPVFDEENPKENRFLYRLANRLHPMTRERTLASQVLIKPGDAYVPRLASESARLLRNAKYIYDADVRVLSGCDGLVDLEVVTKDVWSFAPEISFKRAGGENTLRLGVRETNILGTGKEIDFRSERGVDRDFYSIKYRDPNVRGSRIFMRLQLIDSDDGSEQRADLQLPFYSLDSRRSWSIRLERTDREEKQFFKGDDVSEVRHEFENYHFLVGTSKGLRDGVTRRWSFGYRYETHKFSPTPDLPPPVPPPTDKDLSYPFLLYESIEDKFITSANLDQIHRTEDLNLGRSVVSRWGYSSTGLGGDQDRLVVAGGLRNTLMYRESNDLWLKRLLQHQFNWRGFYNFDTSATEDVILDYRLRFFHVRNPKRVFFASFNAVYTNNLNSNRQVVLGGDTGLRGYDRRFQTGDRRFLVSLEERMFTDLHILQLIRMGWAVFFDMGKAWTPGQDNGTGNDLLKDVGIGLRLSSSRADLGRVMHIDLAFPLDHRDDKSVAGTQILVTFKDSF